MSTRFTCLLGALVVVSIGFLLACGTNYKSTTDGLVVVPTLGSALVQSFSFNLNTGHAAEINNGDGPTIPGPPQQSGPAQIIFDPAGAFAYVAESVPCTPTLSANTSLNGAVQGAIVTYKVNSDGSLSANGNIQYLGGNAAYPTGANAFPTCGLDDSTNPNAGNSAVSLAIDSAGKFLFVATQLAAVSYSVNLNSTPTTSTADMAGNVRVFSIGSGASLTEVPGSPFAVTPPLGGTTANPSALAVSPTNFPIVNAPCSDGAAPTNEFVYVTDEANNQVLEYAVDSSTGALGTPNAFPTGTNPTGVAVDPCARFAYVSNSLSNNVSAYKICPQGLTSCAEGTLSVVNGSPFVAGNGPGPAAVDPTGNFLYVVDTVGSQVSGYRISSANGGLVALSPPAVPTNGTPVAIAIRGDDNWVFVANSAAANVSQYSITPSTGALSPQGPIQTDNYPWGVAVK